MGGRAADIVGPLPLLGPAFMLGGLSAIAAVPIVGLVGAVGLGEGLIAIVTLATTAFVLPAAILSATAPMLVRATLEHATSGSIVGRLGGRDGRRHHGHVPDWLRPPRAGPDAGPDRRDRHRLGRDRRRFDRGYGAGEPERRRWR